LLVEFLSLILADLILFQLTPFHLISVAASALRSDPVWRGCNQSERSRSRCLVFTALLPFTQIRWNEVTL